MTYKDALRIVRDSTRQQVRTIGRLNDDRVLRKVARWRLDEPAVFWEISDLACGRHPHGGGQYRLYGKPKTTYAELQVRIAAETLTECA